MASHKFTTQIHTSSTSHPAISKQSPLPLHSPPFTTQEFSSFPGKISLSQIHAVSDDKVGYVSPRYSTQDLPPTPSSPGKLAQKYMDHVQPAQSSHRKLFNKEQMSVHSQDSVGPQSLKATALVAPYVGDSGVHPYLNQDVCSESPLLMAKSKPGLTSDSSSPGEGHSSDKWKALVETKDHLLLQKNHLIERQKRTIAHLQAQLRDYEERSWASTLRQEDGSLQARQKELEHKNAALQAELITLQAGKRRETGELSNKLDSMEYELHKKTVEFSERQAEREAENTSLRKQTAEQSVFLKELEQKLLLSDHKNRELSEHIVKLNDYFENMPTMEEHQALKEHAHHTDKLCKSLTEQLSERDRQLQEARAKLEDQENSCTKLEHACTELRKELTIARAEAASEAVSKLETEKAQAVQECHRLQKLLFEADKHCQRELEAMRKRHKDRFMEATVDLRTRHKALAKRVKVLEAQLLRNSDAMLAVNEELQLNQGTVSELKSSMKDLLTQNQQLVEKNISLQEASEVSSPVGQGSAKTQHLAVELTQCVRDFKSLVDVSSSLLEGKHSAPLLTGTVDEVDHGGSALASETDLVFAENHESQLEQVRKLRKEVNSLREFVSDQLALQVSSACHIQ